jgi:hypothetical protein
VDDDEQAATTRAVPSRIGANIRRRLASLAEVTGVNETSLFFIGTDPHADNRTPRG